ncbi:CBM96 family carbohydrate-binding protein [Marinoscillum furvescens]|uniref:Putative secreted protein (Por secretion system target) n=1 Tax=Marinoscillum furvescens DSM 4134 TaxID=1122208 RepID=A0A3D9KZI5_MARFU|nr:DNRLRE domain-containing protein [Marinoscillum furvescens]RED95970.1 putative secreted protein (Por secretion system target) [Marinoscillum furvescens DSM 4134]
MKLFIKKYTLVVVMLVGTFLTAQAQEEPALAINVTQDAKVRTGNDNNEASNYGFDKATTGLSRNGIYEFASMMKFDLPGKVVGTIDSVHLSFTLRKNGSLIEFLEYPTDWDESTITYANAPNNGFDTLTVISSFDANGTTNNTVRYSVDITDYFVAHKDEGSIGIGSRSELVENATNTFDMWSKDNTEGYPAPQLLIYGDVALAQSVAITKDAKVRTGNENNEAANFGADKAISGLSRNEIYEFAGMMGFDLPGKVVGRIDSVHIGFTLRKNTGNAIEFLEYSSDWDEEDVTYANAPNNGFDTLSVISTFDASGAANNSVRHSADITDYFLAHMDEGSLNLAVRSELISGSTTEFDIWSKDNVDGYAAPELLIYGDVSFAQAISVTQDSKVRTGNENNEASNFGTDKAISGLSRNDIYEFAGMMKFDMPGNVVGTIDSVQLSFTLRKAGSKIEFLSYPTNWDESTITYANAPNNGFDTLEVISTFDASSASTNSVRYAVNVTDYFNANQENGSIGIAARSELVSGAVNTFDIWAKENVDGYAAPELLIFGDVTIENSVSDSLQLADLKVNGETPADFDPQKTVYNIEVPYADPVPAVSGTALATTSTVEVVNATSIQGDTTLVIVRDTEMDSVIYHLIWEEGDPNRDASLAELLVDGEMIPFFNPIKILYTVDLPFGTTTVPTVTPKVNFEGAVAEVSPAATVSDTTVITVTAQDVTVTKTIKIAWNVLEPNDDPTLSMIIVGSDTLEDFSSNQFAYSYEHDALDVPAIVAIPSDTNSVVSIQLPSALTPGEVEYALVEVVAEDGETKKTYTVGLSTTVLVTGADKQIDLAVYPNPFLNKLTISSDKKIDRVYLFDLNGRLVLETTAKSQRTLDLDLSALPKGQYLLHIGSQDEVRSVKVIK